MYRFRRRDKSSGAFYTTKKVCHVLANNTRMSATTSTNSYRVFKKFNSLAKLFKIEIIYHFVNAIAFYNIRVFNRLNSFFFHNVLRINLIDLIVSQPAYFVNKTTLNNAKEI